MDLRSEKGKVVPVLNYFSTMPWGHVGKWRYSSPLLTSELDGDECSDSRPGRFNLGGKAPDIYCMGGWVGPRDALDDIEKGKIMSLPGIEPRLSRP
jgi:hypothetical protein